MAAGTIRLKGKKQRIIGTVVLVIIAVVVWWFENRGAGGGEGGTRTENQPSDLPRSERPSDEGGGTSTPRSDRAGTSLQELYDARPNDRWVEGEATVYEIWDDDSDPEGGKHQRWTVKLRDGKSVLFAHNIDLAPRVPLREGSRFRYRGEYIWKSKGGVLHWTHHDPRGRRTGGWIEVDGRRYE